MRIAIYGGTFNPPHLGHLAAAQACIRRLRLDRLIFMPAGTPPHKEVAPGSPSAAQRLEMIRLASALVPGTEVSDLELRRTGKSYTVDTVEQLRREHPEDRLWLVVGTDMLASFDRWREPERILRCCRLAAVARLPEEEAVLQRHARRLRRKLGAHIDIVRHDPVPVSSTMIRAGRAGDLIPEPVRRYMEQEGLYDLG